VRRWSGSLALFASRIVLATSLLGSAPAAAQDGKTDAKFYFDAAQKAFAEGRFEDAARAFEEAGRIKPHPAPLINAGDAWEKAGEYALAARAFERVLALQQALEQDRADAIDRLARLRPKIGTIEILGDASARVRVGEEEFRGGDKVHVLPGLHKVTLVDVDGAKVRSVEVAPGTRRSVEAASLRPDARPGPGAGTEGTAPGPQTPAGETRGVRAPTLVAFAVAAAGVAGTVVFGLGVNAAEESYNRDPNREDLDRFDRNKLLANVSLGVAVLGAGVGTYLLLGDLRSEPPPARAARRGTKVPRTSRLGVVPVAGGAQIVLGARL
jgi:tetratricopeptide (TPR) repeat protein